MNRITTYLYRTASAALISFALVSCLEKEPGDYIREEEGMKTFSDAEQTLTGIYSAYKSGALYSGYLTLCPDIQADLVYAVKGNTNVYGRFWLWDVRSTDSEIEAVYGSLYTVIGRCNFFLDQVGALRESLVDDDEIQALDYYTGEVYCARALAYSELIKCFCKAYDPQTAQSELGVVLRTKWFESEPVRRASLYDSYQLVIDDLDKAASLLDPEYDYYNSVYFTSAAVNALRARVALYMQDWEVAVRYASEVIDSGTFTLANARQTYTGTQTYFDYLWTNDSSFEIIWKIGFTTTSYGGALGQVFLNFTNDRTNYYPDYVPAQSVLNLYTSGDLRYDTYFTNVRTGYANGLEWPLLVKYLGNETFLASYIYHVNMPKPFRLAEQYLIRAEAYCRLGNYSKAGADLTTLRQSRFSSGGNLSVNADNWLETISNERVRELYMEGFRLQDLKRWGMGFERTPQSCSQDEGSSLKITKDDPLFTWPIPRNEIEAPGSEIVGNESN
ncbi:MAG: RagB/SusD family nutrient uptake outer membrane protein [Candidatus Cryptobacteroides sp.]